MQEEASQLRLQNSELHDKHQKMCQQQKHMYTLDLSIKTDLLQKLEDHRVIIRDLKRKLDERTAAMAAQQAKHDAAALSAPVANLAHELAQSTMAASPTATSVASAKPVASAIVTGSKEHVESKKQMPAVASPSPDAPVAARPGMSDELKRFMVQPLQLLPPHQTSAHRRPLMFPAAAAHVHANAATGAIEPTHSDSPSSNIRAHTNMSPARETPGMWLLQQRDELVSLTMRQRAKHHEAEATAMPGGKSTESHSKLGMRSPILVDSSASASTIFSMSGRVGSIDAGALETEAIATARLRMPHKSTAAPAASKGAAEADAGANDGNSLKNAATVANDKLVSSRMLQLQEKFSQLQTQHAHLPQQPRQATAPTQARQLRVDISSSDSGGSERNDSVGCMPPARATDDSRHKEAASASSTGSGLLNRVRSQPALSANAQEMKFAANVRAALQPVLRRRWNE